MEEVTVSGLQSWQVETAGLQDGQYWKFDQHGLDQVSLALTVIVSYVYAVISGGSTWYLTHFAVSMFDLTCPPESDLYDCLSFIISFVTYNLFEL